MPDTRDNLVTLLNDRMERLAVMMLPEGPDDWPDLELTMPQFRTLIFIAQEPRRMTDIAAHFGGSPSGATSLIDRLVEKDLIARSHSEDDRRVVTCELTSLGQEQIMQFWRIGQDRINGVASFLSTKELVNIVRSLEVLADATESYAAAVHNRSNGTTLLSLSALEKE